MSEERAKRKLSGILSADAVGYSRLMREDEVETIRALEGSKELMSRLIQQYHGQVVDAPGDNLLAEFASVVDAVECAVEIQKELKDKNAEIPENRRMEFRIGVNLGDVIEEGERIYGDGVNVAARIEGLADPGGICISRTAYDQIKHKLNLGYEYLAEHSVKNIAEPVRVYRILMEPEAAGKVIGEKRFLGKISRRAAIAVVIILIVVAGGLAGWNFYLRQSKRVEPASVDKMTFPLPDKPSIAVLPFDNLSGDPEQEYFSDGITEQIITALSKVPNLFVIARNSTFTYKGKPVKVQKVAEDLAVRYVLEGSSQRADGRVRITAQLIDAIKGHHLWAERYDREIKDIFALQDDIALNVLKALEIKLTAGEQDNVCSKASNNLEAYLKSLEGSYYLNRNTKSDNTRARQLIEESVSLDPGSGMLKLSLGWTHFMDARLGWVKNKSGSVKKAEELAKKALASEENLPGAYTLLAAIYFIKRDWEKAVSNAEQAIAIAPNGRSVYYTTLGGIISCMGKWEEGIPLLKKAIRINPFPPPFHYYLLGRSYLMAGHFDDAIKTFKKALDVNPDHLYAHLAVVPKIWTMC
jgi:adenylate cyclase